MNVSTAKQTYCAVGPGTWRGKVILGARRRIYRMLENLVPVEEMEAVLDVGVTADRACAYSNFFEVLCPHPDRVTALSDQDASWMEEVWPGLRFVRGDGRRLPFPDRSFDFVFSSAVLEHVGSRENQRAFLAECFRVARRHVFVTTPNRWFPLEMHTCLPFVHWLPAPWFRGLIARLGFRDLAEERNLNLLAADDLRTLCGGLDAPCMELVKLRTLGFSSNLLLHLEK